MHHIGRQSHKPTQLNILYRYSNGNCSCCSTWEILVDIYPPGDQSFELYCRIVSFSGRNFKYYWFVSFDRSPSRYHSPPGSDAPDFHFSIQRHVASVPTVSLDCYYSVSKSNSHNKWNSPVTKQHKGSLLINLWRFLKWPLSPRPRLRKQYFQFANLLFFGKRFTFIGNDFCLDWKMNPFRFGKSQEIHQLLWQ